MKLEIQTPTETSTLDLDALIGEYSGIINIGQKCKNVWNTIAIDHPTVDPFQCQIIGAVGNLRLEHGQNRTECPKGLISPKLIPCNGCMGRCVNIHAGRPKYYKRNPEIPTLINEAPVSKWGNTLKEGDIIQFGDVKILVQKC